VVGRPLLAGSGHIRMPVGRNRPISGARVDWQS
jgi:hypothetical protein